MSLFVNHVEYLKTLVQEQHNNTKQEFVFRTAKNDQTKYVNLDAKNSCTHVYRELFDRSKTVKEPKPFCAVGNATQAKIIW